MLSASLIKRGFLKFPAFGTATANQFYDNFLTTILVGRVNFYPENAVFFECLWCCKSVMLSGESSGGGLYMIPQPFYDSYVIHTQLYFHSMARL